MPGDEVHEEPGGSAQSTPNAFRARTGARHAAPRKPLLTRFHVPAGKAIALAAMPSAVLMGMGLTPQLANAKPLPKNPFKDGPCVSAPDKSANQDDDSEAGKARKDAIEKAKKKAEAEKAKKKGEAAEEMSGGGAGDTGDKADKPGGGSSTSPTPAPSTSAPSGGSGSGADEPEPEPTPSKTKNPLDPLGWGDKLKDIFTPGDEKDEKDEKGNTDEKGEADKGSGSSSGSESSASGGGSGASEDSGSGDGSGSGGSGASDKASKSPGAGGESTGKGSAGKAGKDKKTAAEKKKEEDKKKSDAEASKPDENGKKPFPCVEEKKVAGDDEQTPATVPNQPWYLEASSLGLHGLDYKGVVNITMPNGRTKQALKFTASGLDIGDLHQTVKDAKTGRTYHVQAAKGSTSTIRDGQVTMYTEELKGNLFGLIPITFDPEHPPPLNIPEAYFTKVTVRQAGQFGGTLTVPGLHQYITK